MAALGEIIHPGRVGREIKIGRCAVLDLLCEDGGTGEYAAHPAMPGVGKLFCRFAEGLDGAGGGKCQNVACVGGARH